MTDEQKNEQEAGEHQNAGERTLHEQSEGDFVDGEAAGPYGGSDREQNADREPSSTSPAEQEQHAADRQEG